MWIFGWYKLHCSLYTTDGDKYSDNILLDRERVDESSSYLPSSNKALLSYLILIIKEDSLRPNQNFFFSYLQCHLSIRITSVWVSFYQLYKCLPSEAFSFNQMTQNHQIEEKFHLLKDRWVVLMTGKHVNFNKISCATNVCAYHHPDFLYEYYALCIWGGGHSDTGYYKNLCTTLWHKDHLEIMMPGHFYIY